MRICGVEVLFAAFAVTANSGPSSLVIAGAAMGQGNVLSVGRLLEAGADAQTFDEAPTATFAQLTDRKAASGIRPPEPGWAERRIARVIATIDAEPGGILTAASTVSAGHREQWP